MRSLGTLPLYLLMLVICIVLFIVGVQMVIAPYSDNRLAGIAVIIAGAWLWRFAQQARAEYTYQKSIGKLATWAQGLGPGSQKGRRE
jgi:hypothetical protein